MRTKDQYSISTPSSKRLTIIDQNSRPIESWDIHRFYCKNVEDVTGSKQDTKKVRVKIRDNRWDDANVPSYKPCHLWGMDVVFTHKEVDYGVLSGHIDDMIEKDSSRVLELYVTDVSDR